MNQHEKEMPSQNLVAELRSVLGSSNSSGGNKGVFEVVLQNAPMAIAMIDAADYTVLSANSKYLEVVDRLAESFIGKNIFESLPEVREIVLPLFEEVKVTATNTKGEQLAVPLTRFGQTSLAYFNFIYQPFIEDNRVTAIIVVANEVTDLINSKRTLEQTAKQFTSVVKHSPIAMAVFSGPAMKIEMVNEVMGKKIFRKSNEQLIGFNLTDVFPELIDQKFPKLLKQVYESGIAHNEIEAEAYLEGNDGGRTFYFDFEYAPILSLENNVEGIMVTAYDVTDKVKSRKLIIEAEERLRLATEHADLAVWDVDLASQKLRYSQNFPLIFGMAASDIPDRSVFANMILPEDKYIWLQANETAKETGRYNYQARIRRADGIIAWIGVSGKTITNEQGLPVRMLGTVKDATAQIKTEQTITENAEKLKMILDASDLGTWELDPTNMTFTCNKKTSEMFGLDKNKDVDLEQAVSVIDPAYRDKVSKAIQRALQPNSGGKYDITYSILLPNSGEKRIVHARGKVYYDEAGKPVRFTGTNEDITKEREAGRHHEKLYQLVANSKDYMSMASLQGIMTYMNPTGKALLGIKADEDISKKKIEDFYSPAMFAKVKAEIIPAMQAHGGWSGTVLVLHQETGEEIPCHGNYMLIKDPDTNEVISRGLTLRDLRPELKAQKELLDSEKRFRNLVQEAPVATSIYTGKNMTIQWANDAMIKLWGKDKSVIGKTVRQALPELEGQPFHNLLAKVFETGQMYQGTGDKGELVVDGVLQTFYFNFSYKALRDAEGKIYGILNMAIDVTEQVAIKNKLEENEDRLRIAASSGELGVWDLNAATKKMTWDDVAKKLFYFKGNGEITENDFYSIVHKDDVDELKKKVEKTLTDEAHSDFDVEYRIVGEKGIQWLHSRGKAIFLNKRLVRFAGTVVDITAEREALEELKISEQKFRLLADSLPQIIWTADETGMIRYINNSITKFTGASAASLLGNNWLEIVHPDDLNSTMQNWMHAIERGTFYIQEHRLKRHDGSYRWQVTQFSPQKNSEGKTEMWVGSSTDVHEQKIFATELENKVNERTEELKNVVNDLTASNKRLEQFAYVSSHDLQEPLRKIQTFATLVSERLQNQDEKTAEYVQKIRGSAARMSELLKALLQYSRLAVDHEKFEQVDLNEVLEKIKIDFEITIAEKNATVTSDKLPVVKAIPIQMNQLFYNFMSNALKFSEGKTSVSISSRILPTQEQVEIQGLNPSLSYHHITFSDNGIGFSNEYKDKIFTIFQRLHDRSRYEGTGIGLAICKRIMENHNGVIDADSTEGKGSTFNIYLPL